MQSTADMEQEAELEVSITFDELQCFDSEDISTCVSVQSALKICQKSVANLSAKTVEVLSLWLRKLLRGYINETECCIEVFKCLYEWLLRMKADVTPENKTACTDFIMLLADAADFAEWAKGKLLAAGERLVHTTSFFLLAIVYSCLQMSNENQVEELKGHESKAIELHLSVLHILQEITNASTRAHARITPVLRQLVEIADFLSLKLTHLNAFVKTSKTMTNICTHYKSLESSQSEGNGMPDWMQETLLHLCDTVLNQLEVVYEQPSTSPEEHMKIIQVYLIMLHKLLNTGVKHMDKTVLEAIFLLLNGGENKPTNDISPEIPLLIAKYMQPYIMQIYELLYQLEDFQKHLITCLNEAAQNNEDYDELCLDYVNVCIIDDAELNQLTYQILQNIFEYLCRDAGNFCNAARYKRILEVFGSLLHVSCSEELFNYFYAGLFEDDVINSQICADVLMLSYRLEEKQSGWSKNALEKLTKYWLKCNNSYAIFSQNPSQWHVQRMLKYFHNLNRNRDPPVFNLHNYRYVSCVSAKTEQEQHLWLLQLQRLLHNPLNDIEQYYEILALMELLSSASSDWLLSLPPGINELLLKGTYQRLNNTYFKLALKANSATKLHILQTVMPSKSVATSCWHVQRFLHDCRSSGNAQLKSLAGQHAPATDLCSLLHTLQPTLPLSTASIDNPTINYAKLAYRSKQTHRCKQANLKRKRAECEPKNILEQLEQNTQQLSECSSDLDAANLKQLSSIVKTLQNILVEQQML